MATTVGSALARASLAGNPSDAFGGAVLATVVPGLAATVRVADAGHRRAPRLDDGGLLDATLRRARALRRAAALRSDAGADASSPLDLDLTWSTSIPRSVGLGGSSAIVVAAVRALAERWAIDVDVVTTARLALDVEVDDLGIAAGPQDRLVQASGRTVLLDFAGEAWDVRPVDPPEQLDLFVVWSTVAPTPSQQVHGPLQARRDEPAVVAAMAALGQLARDAAGALTAGDRHALGAAMDASFEQRASILDLDPMHVALVDGVRAAEAAANYAGSGGAVVGLPLRPDAVDAAAAWAAAAGHGFHRVAIDAVSTTAAADRPS